MKNILTITIASLFLLLVSCQKESIEPTTTVTTGQQTTTDTTTTTTTIDTTSTTNNPPSNLSLLDYLEGQNDCSIFYQAIFRTGIDIDISGDGPFTIFAPTDVAFQAFLDNNNWTSIDDISQNTLTMIVKFHLSNVGFIISELQTGTNVPLFLAGKEAYINMDDTTNPFIVLGLTSAVFVETDLEHTNGFVQKIGGVLAL